MSLHENLSEKRNDLARNEDCSPYMVASNAAHMGSSSEATSKSTQDFKSINCGGMNEIEENDAILNFLYQTLNDSFEIEEPINLFDKIFSGEDESDSAFMSSKPYSRMSSTNPNNQMSLLNSDPNETSKLEKKEISSRIEDLTESLIRLADKLRVLYPKITEKGQSLQITDEIKVTQNARSEKQGEMIEEKVKTLQNGKHQETRHKYSSKFSEKTERPRSKSFPKYTPLNIKTYSLNGPNQLKRKRISTKIKQGLSVEDDVIVLDDSFDEAEQKKDTKMQDLKENFIHFEDKLRFLNPQITEKEQILQVTNETKNTKHEISGKQREVIEDKLGKSKDGKNQETRLKYSSQFFGKSKRTPSPSLPKITLKTRKTNCLNGTNKLEKKEISSKIKQGPSIEDDSTIVDDSFVEAEQKKDAKIKGLEESSFRFEEKSRSQNSLRNEQEQFSQVIGRIKDTQNKIFEKQGGGSEEKSVTSKDGKYRKSFGRSERTRSRSHPKYKPKNAKMKPLNEKFKLKKKEISRRIRDLEESFIRSEEELRLSYPQITTKEESLLVTGVIEDTQNEISKKTGKVIKAKFETPIDGKHQKTLHKYSSKSFGNSKRTPSKSLPKNTPKNRKTNSLIETNELKNQEISKKIEQGLPVEDDSIVLDDSFVDAKQKEDAKIKDWQEDLIRFEKELRSLNPRIDEQKPYFQIPEKMKDTQYQIIEKQGKVFEEILGASKDGKHQELHHKYSSEFCGKSTKTRSQSRSKCTPKNSKTKSPNEKNKSSYGEINRRQSDLGDISIRLAEKLLVLYPQITAKEQLLLDTGEMKDTQNEISAKRGKVIEDKFKTSKDGKHQKTRHKYSSGFLEKSNRTRVQSLPKSTSKNRKSKSLNGTNKLKNAEISRKIEQKRSIEDDVIVSNDLFGKTKQEEVTKIKDLEQSLIRLAEKLRVLYPEITGKDQSLRITDGIKDTGNEISEKQGDVIEDNSGKYQETWHKYSSQFFGHSERVRSQSLPKCTPKNRKNKSLQTKLLQNSGSSKGSWKKLEDDNLKSSNENLESEDPDSIPKKILRRNVSFEMDYNGAQFVSQSKTNKTSKISQTDLTKNAEVTRTLQNYNNSPKHIQTLKKTVKNKKKLRGSELSEDLFGVETLDSPVPTNEKCKGYMRRTKRKLANSNQVFEDLGEVNITNSPVLGDRKYIELKKTEKKKLNSPDQFEDVSKVYKSSLPECSQWLTLKKTKRGSRNPIRQIEKNSIPKKTKSVKQKNNNK